MTKPETQEPPVVLIAEREFHLLPASDANSDFTIENLPRDFASTKEDDAPERTATEQISIDERSLAKPNQNILLTSEGISAPDAGGSSLPARHSFFVRTVRFIVGGIGKLWNLASLFVLLAVVSAVPIVQLASLGYLLQAAVNVAKRGQLGAASYRTLPGTRLAGRLGVFFLLASIMWLPVWLITDLSYSSQLLTPDSNRSMLWRVAACAITSAWLMYVVWAAMRGGRLRHFLWPAPWRFGCEIWRPSLWRKASDDFYETVSALHFPQLWWLGARAAVGALLWLAVPVSMMIIGERAFGLPIAGLVGLIGTIAMTLIMLYLPFLQIQLAIENRFTAIFSISAIRRRFRFSPWLHGLALTVLCLLCLPVYLLRIEATPAELLWAPSLVFVLFMLPAKLMIGFAMAAGDRRELIRQLPRRNRFSCWTARLIGLASALVYVGFLYLSQLVAGQGAFVMYFQHAFLVPVLA